MTDYRNRSYTINVRLTPAQIAMLISLIATRLNQITSLALIRNHACELRRQWNNIKTILEETLSASERKPSNDRQ